LFAVFRSSNQSIIGWIFSPDKAERQRQYRVYGKAIQRGMAEKDG